MTATAKRPKKAAAPEPSTNGTHANSTTSPAAVGQLLPVSDLLGLIVETMAARVLFTYNGDVSDTDEHAKTLLKALGVDPKKVAKKAKS